MAWISINFLDNGTPNIVHGASKGPLGNYAAQILLQHEYDFGDNVSVNLWAENSISGAYSYQSVMIDKYGESDGVHEMSMAKRPIITLEFFDRTDGQVLTRLRGRLHDGGGLEDLEENFGGNPDFVSSHLDYQVMLQSLFDKVETKLAGSITQNSFKAANALDLLLDRFTGSNKPITLKVPKVAISGNTFDSGGRWNQMVRAVAPNYIGIIGADDIAQAKALMTINERTGGHLFIDVGNKTNTDNVVALATTLGYDNHQVRLLWNPTKSRPSDGSSIKKSWRPCVGDYIAKHILRNQLRDANGIPPLHIPVGGYDFPVNFLGVSYQDGFFLSDADQERLAQVGIIMVLNERFNRESRWIYGDVLTQRNSRTSALRLANAAEIATFTARGIIEISKRHLLSSMSDYRNKAMSEGSRFLENCVAAGLLEPAEQLGGLYYSLSIEPRADKPFEAVDIKLARRAVGAVRQAYLETTINK